MSIPLVDSFRSRPRHRRSDLTRNAGAVQFHGIEGIVRPTSAPREREVEILSTADSEGPR